MRSSKNQSSGQNDVCLINSIWLNNGASQICLLIGITWGAFTMPSLGCTQTN
jgi:hypothetical protein